MHKIYLAGFDVFRPDAIEHGEKLKKLCTAAGVIGLYPLDNDIPQGLAMEDAAQWICKSNMAMLTQADAVLANLESFRGHEPDSGTVFEVGVAIALGKPVWAYFPESVPLRQQVSTDQFGCCPDGYIVENFNLPKNLMIACQWAGSSHNFETALNSICSLMNTSTEVSND